MKKIACIVHGKLKNKLGLLPGFKETFSGDYALTFYITEYPGHAIALTEKAISEGSTLLICVGGDGSLNEVMNGMLLSKNKLDREQWEELRLALFPKGSGNDFAKTLNIKPDINLLKDLVDRDRFNLVDLGLIKYTDCNAKPAERYFINITDIGMGGIVAQKLASYSKWMGSFLTMQRAIISTLMNFKKQKIRCTIDALNYEVEVINLVVANGKYFGAGMGIAPDAEISDGLFSIVIIGNVSTLDYVKLSKQVRRCMKIVHPEVKYLSAKEVSVTSDMPLPIDMDGEFLGYSPLHLTMVPSMIKIIS